MDPRLQVALAIHDGACRLMASDVVSSVAMKYSTEVMEKILPDLNMKDVTMAKIMVSASLPYATKEGQEGFDKTSSVPPFAV